MVKTANKSLGRGLSAFLDTQTESDVGNIVKLGLDQIKANPYQPRRFFDEDQLNSLASSIERKGVLQPILVRKLSDNVYQLIAGERRLRASKIAGLEEIPAIVAEFNPEEQLEVAILENVQRENLNPLEEAEGYKRLIEEFNHTQEELSQIVGKSRSHIANILRLLTLPDDVQQLIKEGKLSFGHARALVSSENASSIAKEVLDHSLNVRETEKLTQRNRGEDYQYPEIYNLSRHIAELTGLKTKIKLRGKGGEITMSFDNFVQLDSFIQRMNR